MAEKRKDFRNYGYEDERFEKELSDCHNLHCAICSNVFKDPVMCKNEHCFCRACITEHLKNSKNCPCCNQHLRVESLTVAPRILRNLLSELRIRCDYHERGCEEFVQLSNLASHVATCAKAPVMCVNEKCSSEMNREDQARHESEECRFRKVKCRSCKEMDAMMQEIGASLSGMNTNVSEQRSEMKSGLTAMKDRFQEMENKFDRLESRFDEVENQFETRDQRRESMQEMELNRNDQATQADLASDVQCAKNPDENAYIVAGGYGKENVILNSVEIFDKTGNCWRLLQSMKKCRANASSVVYKGKVIVTGGTSDDGNILSSIEQFTRNPNPFAPPYWTNFSVNLPRPLRGHGSVVYNDRLLVIGGHDEENKQSYVIYEIQLHFPFNTKVLAKIPSPRPITSCGVVLVDDKILILGARQGFESDIANVTMYDITRNEFKELKPLPYKVCDMGVVKYGENVILAGGYDGWFECKNTVISYDIETQKSTTLPPMKDTRSGCGAVLDGNSIVVMGGHDATSVEAFDLRSSVWRSLPSMNEARRGCVAEIV